MVFNAPTQLNYTSADLYAFERRKIQQYNMFLRFRPEVMSHTYVEISYNRDLQDNADLPWHRKIRFVVRSRKKFCSQVSCQSHYPRGNTCRPDDEPRIFKTGDHDVEACQQGCYNLYERTRVDQPAEQAAEPEYARAPFLIYSYRQCACTVHNNGLFALGVDDYVRTDHHPLPRVDTIGTGFHYVDSGNFFDRGEDEFSPAANQPFLDLEGNESFRFNVNRYYCDDFRLKFDGNRCYASAGENVFGFLVSSSLYKACQYGVRYAATGVTNTQVQKLSLPPVKHKVRHATLASWKNDVDEDAFFINPNVSLLDLGFREDMKHCIFTTEYGYPGKLVEPLASGKNVTGNLVDYEKRNKDRLPQFRYDVKTGQREIDEYEMYNIYTFIRSNPNGRQRGDFTNASSRLVDMFRAIVANLGEVGAMLTLGYLLDKGLKYSANLVKMSSMYFEGVITPTMLHLMEREFLTQSYHPAIKAFSRTVTAVARTTASFIKVVDVVSTVAGFLDLLDIGFDFFNMNRIMDTGTVRQYSELDIESVRKAYGYGTFEYSPVSFMLMCEHLQLPQKWQTTPRATMKLRCIKDYTKYAYMLPVHAVTNFYENNENSYEWVSEYIFSLRTNSNGLAINWEDEERLPDDVAQQYRKIDETIYHRSMDEYAKFTESFRRRVDYSLYAIVAAVVLFAVVALLYMQLVVPVLFIVGIAAIYIVFAYLQRRP